MLQPLPGFTSSNSSVEKNSSMENLLTEFIKESRNQINLFESTVMSHKKTIQNMEVQISQIATAMNTMQKGKFPSCTEKTQSKILKQ